MEEKDKKNTTTQLDNDAKMELIANYMNALYKRSNTSRYVRDVKLFNFIFDFIKVTYCNDLKEKAFYVPAFLMMDYALQYANEMRFATATKTFSLMIDLEQVEMFAITRNRLDVLEEIKQLRKRTENIYDAVIESKIHDARVIKGIYMSSIDDIRQQYDDGITKILS